MASLRRDSRIMLATRGPALDAECHEGMHQGLSLSACSFLVVAQKPSLPFRVRFDIRVDQLLGVLSAQIGTDRTPYATSAVEGVAPVVPAPQCPAPRQRPARPAIPAPATMASVPGARNKIVNRTVPLRPASVPKALQLPCPLTPSRRSAGRSRVHSRVRPRFGAVCRCSRPAFPEGGRY